jgi:type IV pilus assembly protein PilY1
MKTQSSTVVFAAALLGTLYASAGFAQVAEDFTGTATNNTWYYSGGACLTASTAPGSGTEFTQTTAGVAGTIPGCTAIKSNSDAYGGETLVGGTSGTLPDTSGYGALRFTNGCISGNCTGSSAGGHNQFGAIISGSTFSSSAGVQVTFKTVTYRGDSQGTGGDGADGISFFLMDGGVTANIGQYGGSLAYSCSNQNANYGFGGMVGGYIGLGIDEYGNFLNGSSNTLGETGSTSTNSGQGDNTASGGLYMPNRIGMRGAGNVAWSWLHAKYPTLYPTMTAALQAAAVQKTCLTGTLWNYANSSSPVNTNTTAYNGGATLYDYTAIPNAYKVLSGVTIANEYSTGGLTRGNATPILYKLKITSSGLLSLSYSYNGGAYQSVLANQSITASNGTLPANLAFGFAGSTGGSSNIHEVLCFKAAAADTSSSSATTNQTQSSRVTSSTQAYFSYYDPNVWTGTLTANAVSSDSAGNLSIASQATWDASCVLTGVKSASTCPNTGAAGPIAAEGSTNRVILSWNPTLNNGTGGGIPFEFTSLSSAQQAALNLGDATSTANRLSFLRGDRSNEVNTAGVGLFRDRISVLADIIDSSPVAVGQPVLPYAGTWIDKLNTSATMPENASGAQTYSQFFTAEQTRLNMVYVGANDGMLHGFRAGFFDTTNTFQNATAGGTVVNDGSEVLAYFPGSTLASAASSTTSTLCASTVATQTAVQTIHGETPLIGTSPACFQPVLDYSNTQYGHNFFVDATPAAGDLFYGNAWHTWLVGGLGAGGAALYALDVTTPANFTESSTNAASVVIGEWNAANITCAIGSNCANNLGNTYGTPLIRRLHNGDWAVIFGNGFGSSSGDAGVFIMTVDSSSGAKTFYYLSTGKSGTGDGIAYVSSVDLDGDHIADYLYAGDLLGNVWRFDLTSATPSSWAVSTGGPLFAAGSTHPITSSLVVGVVAGPPGNQIIVAFGSGQKTPLTNTSGATYASAQQYLYAFWDWNYASWNALASGAQYASLTAGTPNTSGFTSTPYTLTPSNLTAQTLAIQSTGIVDLTSHTICWQGGSAACTSGNTSFGWYAALPGTKEQVIYNPLLVGSAFSVNTIVPAANSLLSCTTSLDSGYTYAIALGTGAVAPASSGSTSFFKNTTQTNTTTTTNSSGQTTTTTTTTVVPNTDANAAGVQTNATGTSTVMTTSTNTASSGITGGGTGSTVSCTLGGVCNTLPTNLSTVPGPFASVTGCSAGNTYLVYQTTSGTASYVRVAPKCPLIGNRATRTQLR